LANIADEEVDELDENWEQYKVGMMKEIELREAQQRALFDDGEEENESISIDEDEEVRSTIIVAIS
jgi:hypothetical protein